MMPTNSINVDRFTTPAHLVEFALLEQQLTRHKPFATNFSIARTCVPASLVPDGMAIQRCVTSPSSVTLLAGSDDASLRLEIDSRVAYVAVCAVSPELVETVADAVRTLGRLGASLDEGAKVRIWFRTDDNVRSQDRLLEAPEWSTIARNYPSQVRSEIDHSVRLVRPTGSGKLLLWHGPPGTGKTTAVRALLRAWDAWCRPQYIADPERFFGEPDYISQVLTKAATDDVGPTLHRAGSPEAVWRLIIAEDTDEYLRSTARRDSGAALGRLLNLSDGILGQGMNLVILLTTNEDITRLHPALTRPGRCLAKTEFTAFTEHEAAAWLGRRPDTNGRLTLAELLAMRGDLGSSSSNERAVVEDARYV